MKTAAKVFLILGMVVQCFLIYPIILGALAIKKINNAKTAKELTGWGVVSLLIVNLIGGILMLCMKDKDLVD